jgi:phosphatidylserine/phosphatidylglycerophosphate/cardiolipin synthase-like enzyme
MESEMSTSLKVYANEDDALLFWSVAKPIEKCRGFAIERKRTTADGKKGVTFLPNRIGFENQPEPAKKKAGQKAILKPSTEWPFQRFSWTDHDANTGDTVSYRVIPVIRNDNGDLELLESQASAFSQEKTLGTAGHSRFRPFFNRGFVMSQFMARYLSERNLTLAQFKKTIKDKDDKTIRHFLSGDLRLALLNELKQALDEGGHIFAALFELSDDELIKALAAMKKRAHVVLSNGSVQAKKGESSADARKRDENQDARRLLMAKGVAVEVEETHRFISPGALGHNKFMVRTDKDGNPITVWTGSLNWAPTGLCTQVNNGILIDDPDVARVYLDQWQELRKAQSGFPKDFVAGNSVPKPVGKDTPGKPRCVVWFTRTNKGVDLEALQAEVRKARQGVLFLMFMPGGKGLLAAVNELASKPNLYVRGVVSTLPGGLGDESSVQVKLIDQTKRKSLRLDVIQPEGVKHPFATFAEEVSRKQFLGGVGHAIIHSKILVIDPFSADPVVITGSHNFSTTASQKNDENFIIVKGDSELAEAYAVNILGAYAHYRWRAFLSETNRPFNGLKDNDTWQAPMLRSNKKDLKFWGV